MVRVLAGSERARWFATEVIVIIAGILIALAIDEWRQNIADKEVETEYIQQLVTDLRGTEASVTDSSSEASVGDNSISLLIDAFGSVESISSAEVIELIYASAGFYNPTPILGTIEALVATGDLRLIRDEVTRSAITQYQSYSRDVLLTPIYDIEERYAEYVHQLLVLAAADGIYYSDERYNLSRRTEPDVESFLSNERAYVIILGMADLRGHFAWYRNELNSTAMALREKLEID